MIWLLFQKNRVYNLFYILHCLHNIMEHPSLKTRLPLPLKTTEKSSDLVPYSSNNHPKAAGKKKPQNITGLRNSARFQLPMFEWKP